MVEFLVEKRSFPIATGSKSTHYNPRLLCLPFMELYSQAL
jgi:hypothetical protein